jgi:stalled ribosome rescue protein Dom34
MKKQAGVWIDHKEAFIVFVGEGTQEAHRTASEVEKHVRYSGHAASQEGSADDQRDRQYAAHLGKYYDEVISQLSDTESVFILGPGEAKGEFEKRLVSKGLGARVAGVETADKMTPHQVSAKVRQHFQK